MKFRAIKQAKLEKPVLGKESQRDPHSVHNSFLKALGGS